MSEPAVTNGEPTTVNKYPDGTVASRVDVVLADDGGRYVVIDPTLSVGFVLLAHIENPTHFKRKARVERCQKQTPGEVERQHAAEVLARIGASKKHLQPRRRPHASSAKVE
jgi:hypothetical protein